MAFVMDFPFLDELTEAEMAPYRQIFRPWGYLYSVFGGMIAGLDLDPFLIVLMVRDPRDVLVSEYFSMAFSHQPPPDMAKYRQFMSLRQTAAAGGIDRYVLTNCERIRATYDRYARALLDRPNVHLTRYETMVADFPKWLGDLIEFCVLRIDDTTMRQLLREGSRPSEGEDSNRHRRQVNPGEFRRKLTDETMAILNEELKDVLRIFNYS